MHRSSGSTYACLHGEHGHCDKADEYEDNLHPLDSGLSQTLVIVTVDMLAVRTHSAVACYVGIVPIVAF